MSKQINQIIWNIVDDVQRLLVGHRTVLTEQGTAGQQTGRGTFGTQADTVMRPGRGASDALVGGRSPEQSAWTHSCDLGVPGRFQEGKSDW